MKTRFLPAAALFAVLAVGASAQTPGALKAFNAAYPGAVRVEWETEGAYQVADFRLDNIEQEAWFDSQGKWLMTTADLSFNQLPAAVRSSFSSGKYAGKRADDVSRVNRADMPTIYLISLENGSNDMTLYYDAKGNLIKEIAGDYKPGLPPVIPSSVRDALSKAYPKAEIIDADHHGNGKWEIEVLDANHVKEVWFDNSGKWMMTVWDITRADLPQAVLATLTKAPYASYRIEDLRYTEYSSGVKAYSVELDKPGSEDRVVNLDADGKVLDL